MKFLVAARLPARLAAFLAAAGHDATHTTALPEGNRSTDRAIAARADAEGRVVVTKDADFRNGHLLQGSPQRLLTVATGNISNDALLGLFSENLDAIERTFASARHIELRADAVIIHDSHAP